MGASTEGLPSLSTFFMELEFFKRLGLRRQDLADRPVKEIEDYCFYISMIQRKEDADQRQQQQQRSAPSGRG